MSVYTTRQARAEQSKVIGEVRAGEHPLVTYDGEDLMRWVSVDWYEKAQHAMRVVAGLETLSCMLQWGEPRELREMGAALKELAAMVPGGGPCGPSSVLAVS